MNGIREIPSRLLPATEAVFGQKHEESFRDSGALLARNFGWLESVLSDG